MTDPQLQLLCLCTFMVRDLWSAHELWAGAAILTSLLSEIVCEFGGLYKITWQLWKFNNMFSMILMDLGQIWDLGTDGQRKGSLNILAQI